MSLLGFWITLVYCLIAQRLHTRWDGKRKPQRLEWSSCKQAQAERRGPTSCASSLHCPYMTSCVKLVLVHCTMKSFCKHGRQVDLFRDSTIQLKNLSIVKIPKQEEKWKRSQATPLLLCSSTIHVQELAQIILKNIPFRDSSNVVTQVLGQKNKTNLLNPCVEPPRM